MKKKLFITSTLLLSSILTISGCASTPSSDTSSTASSSEQTSGSSQASSSEEVKVNAKEELNAVLKASEAKLEEEVKKNTFKLTLNGADAVTVKGNVNQYTNTIVSQRQSDGTYTKTSETQSEKTTLALNESATSTQKYILSLDTDYYKSLQTETHKATNDSYAYGEVTLNTNLSTPVQSLFSNVKEAKEQIVLKDGEGYLYEKFDSYADQTTEQGLPFDYSVADSYISAGYSYLNNFLAQEGVTNRLNYLKTTIKALLPEGDEESAVIVDKVFALINDLYTYATTGGDLNLDSALDLYEKITGTTNLDEETKTFIKKTVNALLKIFDIDKVVTYEKVNGSYKMNLNYKVLLAQVKTALTTLKAMLNVQFANDADTLALINELFTNVNASLETYAPTNVNSVVTFTVKDGLLAGVEEELKLQGLTVNGFVYGDEGSDQNGNSDTYTTTQYLLDLSISELTLTTNYSFSYEALSKDALPEVTKVPTQVTPAE